MALVRLSDFLISYPQFSLAQESDESELRNFFETSSMEGDQIDMEYHRSPNFFSFLKAHSNTFYVFILKNENGEIQGAGTVVLRPAYVEGKIGEVAYLGDLRIGNVKKWGKVWRQFYSEFLKQFKFIQEFSRVEYVYTCILAENKKARLALDHAQKKLGYHPYHDYRMVNILKRLWFPINSSLNLVSWDNVDLKELAKFYRIANKPKPLGFVFEKEYDELDWRFKNWPGLKIENGWCVIESNQIIAAAIFWSPEQVKRIHIKRLSSKLRKIFGIVSFLTPLPSEGTDFKVLYLNMLDFSTAVDPKKKKIILRLLIDQGLKLVRERGYHALSLPEFDCFQYNDVLRPYLHFKHDLKMYLVDPAKNPGENLSRNQVPGFEMSLV